MNRLIGIYGNRNRLQVWLTMFLFTLCAWWTLNPQQLHLLDGTTVALALPAGAVMDFRFPFNFAAGSSEIIFLLLTVAVPFILHVYFKYVGARYMSAANYFWFAYAAQNCFRLLNAKIYRLPALIMYLLSLFLLVVALLKCLQNSETGAEDGFKCMPADTDPGSGEETP